MQVIDGLKVGNEALKKIHEVLNVDEVERILEETREGIEKQREIDDLLVGVLTPDDEEAVEGELERIIQAEMPDVPEEEPLAAEPALPDVPSEPEKAREGRRKEKVALEVA
ncbi:Charged multivesicular body protein 6 [Cryptotermes secundus]|nr:Charged multivesicular body protein 6 [Cryptotermes secundus]